MVSVSCFGVIILLVQFLVAEWPPFGKQLPARLTIFYHCILSICTIYLFPDLVLRAGFAF